VFLYSCCVTRVFFAYLELFLLRLMSWLCSEHGTKKVFTHSLRLAVN
jgi:hypothetical protein